MNPLSPAPEIIAIAGDWHGNTSHAIQSVKYAFQRGATVVVHVGDFGFWTAGPAADKYLFKLDQYLLLRGLKLFWVDGNHEDHNRLNALPVDPETGLRQITPSIFHIPRGFRWEWHGKVWMGVGGAASVDRHWRKPGVSWWPGEYLTEDDVIFAAREGRVDYIVSHDVPLGVDVPSLRKAGGWPIQDLSRSDQNRDKLAMIVRAVRPTGLFHGHYHCRYSSFARFEDNVVMVEGLDCDNTPLRDNVIILNLVNGPAPELIPS